ncbi:MAG: thiamine-phosphate synthase family protein, partial [Methanobacteriota archaeon]
EAAPGFARLIPHVGTNVAAALPGASEITEVAAIPGRIFEMRGRVRVPAAPELGASRHVGEVVLAVTARFPETRAAVNVAASERVLRAAFALGLSTAEMPARHEGRREGLAKVLEGLDAAPDLLFHRGDFGVEPVAYVLAPDAPAAVAKAARLADWLERHA